MLRELISLANTACESALKEVGFQRKGGLLRIDVSDDVIGSVGLNRATFPSERAVWINPVIGVSYYPLEVRVAELEGRTPLRRYRSPLTISRQLGYLMSLGKFAHWTFSDEVDPSEVASQLALAVVNDGFPFIHQHQTLLDFYESMVTRRFGGREESFAYRLPVAALMLGMRSEAEKHARQRLNSISERQDAGAERYREFVTHLFESMERA